MLFADPQDTTVEVNQWAQFNCTVQCGYHVSWYMAGHSSAIASNNTVPGLEIRILHASVCTSDRRIHFFEVHASSALNAQCFTVPLMRDPDNVACAGVPVGDVTAGQLSSQVGID